MIKCYETQNDKMAVKINLTSDLEKSGAQKRGKLNDDKISQISNL